MTRKHAEIKVKGQMVKNEWKQARRQTRNKCSPTDVQPQHTGNVPP